LDAVSQLQLRRPLVGIATAFLMGMGIAVYRPLDAGFLFFVSLFSLLLALLCLKTSASTWFLLISCGSLAACHYTISVYCLPEYHVIRRFKQLPQGQIHIEGRIVGVPEFYPYSSGDRGSWRFPLKCFGEKTPEGWKKLSGSILVQLTDSRRSDPPEYGERIWFSGILKKRKYTLSGEKFVLIVSAYDRRQRLSCPRRSLTYWSLHLRDTAAETLTKGLERFPGITTVMKALLLGYRRALPQETYEKFVRTGTLHIFAISGLHVGMVGILIASILKAACIPRKFWGLWLFPLLLMYVLATGMKSSAFRALAMASLYFFAPIFGRKPDVPSSIAFAAIILLLFNPAQITSAGFIFSFAVVSSIVMVFSAVPERVFIFSQSPYGPDRTAFPAPRLIAAWIWRYSISLIVTSFAAAIASFPLSARFFSSFSPLSLIGNIFVVPLTFIIILTGWLSIITGAVSSIAAEIFNHANCIFIEWLLGIVNLLSQVPGACAHIIPPPLLAILLWFLGWILLLTHARTARERIFSLGLIILAVIWALTSAFAQKASFPNFPGTGKPAAEISSHWKPVAGMIDPAR